ncbi:MAG: hypothetical protein H7Z21_02540 [Hymenobacter sp.]|nr:hypothetical protein [Hymenobacter sp.]
MPVQPEAAPRMPDAALPAALPLIARAPAALPDSTVPQRPAPVRPAHRLAVGVLGAPVLSAVRMLRTARAGGNLGLTLEYRLTDRLRVRTGLIRSIKRYAAASSDYTPPPEWHWYSSDYEVNAHCRITEIPLDLRYDLVSRPTYTVFAGVGLTSLLMRNERYAYDYWLNGQPRTAAAKVRAGTNHVFGLLTVSGGVEHPLGGRWTGQAEPFWQLPLGGVGAGKVRLSSVGAAFSLKYGLGR